MLENLALILGGMGLCWAGFGLVAVVRRFGGDR